MTVWRDTRRRAYERAHRAREISTRYRPLSKSPDAPATLKQLLSFQSVAIEVTKVQLVTAPLSSSIHLPAAVALLTCPSPTYVLPEDNVHVQQTMVVPDGAS